MSDGISYDGAPTPAPEEDSGWAVATPIQVGTIFIGMLGVVGNMACVIVLRRQSVRNNTNLLIVNQAIIDCITSGLLVAATISDLGGIRTAKKSGVAAKIYCNLWNSLVLVFGGFAISTFNLVALSVERYLAVIHPIWYLQNFKKRAVRILVVCTWVFGPIFQILLVALHYDTTEEGTCLYTPRYTGILVMLFFWDYFIPACIMTFSFAAIMLKFKKLNKVADGRGAGEFKKKTIFPIPSTSAQPAPSEQSPPSEQPTENSAVEANGNVTKVDDLPPVEEAEKQPSNHLEVPTVVDTTKSSTPGEEKKPDASTATKSSSGQGNTAGGTARSDKDAAGALQRRNTTKVLLAMYIVYLVCWSPNQWTFLQYNLGGYVDFSSAWYRFLVIMGNLNTCVNPFLFALRLKVYRNEARAMVRNFLARFSRD
ncbi:alpha-2A adrenergic receptor-like [Lytechinus variegatus]|uniref:alpha-2A adrenergic receptor-like n=1 Tax=Lytechinus variegatus TaxID=7654 RepID=UPI001BB1EB16|nr:alpha-2A adrenergic receptor-like [Lytechinus variegatus]